MSAQKSERSRGRFATLSHQHDFGRQSNGDARAQMEQVALSVAASREKGTHTHGRASENLCEWLCAHAQFEDHNVSISKAEKRKPPSVGLEGAIDPFGWPLLSHRRHCAPATMLTSATPNTLSSAQTGNYFVLKKNRVICTMTVVLPPAICSTHYHYYFVPFVIASLQCIL